MNKPDAWVDNFEAPVGEVMCSNWWLPQGFGFYWVHRYYKWPQTSVSKYLEQIQTGESSKVGIKSLKQTCNRWKMIRHLRAVVPASHELHAPHEYNEPSKVPDEWRTAVGFRLMNGRQNNFGSGDNESNNAKVDHQILNLLTHTK